MPWLSSSVRQVVPVCGSAGLRVSEEAGSVDAIGVIEDERSLLMRRQRRREVE
jgi:hypothetical protein